MDRLESFMLGCLSAFIAFAYISFKFRFLFNVKIVILSIFGFFLKLLVGYAFWELYMWPDYFTNQFSQMQFSHYEYLYTPSSMQKIAEYRLENGFFSLPLEEFYYQKKYFFINYIMSNLFMSGSSNYFDLSIQNTLFSFYSAVIVSLIGFRFGGNRREVRLLFLLTFFQPLSINSAIIWRDVVGQFFFFSGVYFFLLSGFFRPVKAFFGVTIAALSMALLRTVYIFIPFLLAVKYMRDKSVSGSIAGKIFLLGLLATVVTIFFSTDLSLFVYDGYSTYLNHVLNVKFLLLLPVDILRTIIGPFPWINWFEFTDNTIFLVSHYLQAVYVVVILYYTILNYKRCSYPFKFYLVLTLILLLIMAVAVTEVQSSYFSFAVALLLPISAFYLSVTRFVISYTIVFYGFIVLNFIYIVAGFHGAGLGKFL